MWCFSLQLVVSFLFASALVTAAPGRKKQGAVVAGLGLPIKNIDATNIIPNSYIAVYTKNATDDIVAAHQATVAAAIRKRGLAARSTDGSTVLSTVMTPYTMGTWRAMSFEADDAMVIEMSNCQWINYIEADTKVAISTIVQQTRAPAGLERISHKAAGEDAYVFDDSAGAGITVYVVDTGILTTHSDFGGRATWGTNTVNRVDTDENGHGSHVAGTVGGTTFGVAKKANLVAVKVLGADGGGSNSGVIKGLDFVLRNVTASGLAGKAVVNMSVGGGFQTSTNNAVEALIRAGITVVTAAGNENQDAILTSPASAPNAITVGAIDALTDTRASFSNFGSVVDIFAPGVDVQSVGITSNTASNTLSGTSMASPHVAGLAAYLMSLEGLTTANQVVSRMLELSAATGAVVAKPGAGTDPENAVIASNGSGF
ncbi:putative subtilisin-like protease [Amylocarpus encephaloides]|uniref:Subtilisin-like protease n=1 Tax=Amylocarpus encephaloides TaxID=45428 RepID=A0A9P8C4F7_9HELO|nr:putative subtilisin-like protease [Amylocarpus encephaloides]